MALTVWTLVTEVEEHLQVSNLIGDTQLWYVNSVKKTIAEILWQKINNNNEINIDNHNSLGPFRDNAFLISTSTGTTTSNPARSIQGKGN